MQPRAVEYGTLWALETNEDLPPICLAGIEAAFVEMGIADSDDLAVAMNVPASEIRRRLQGNRRCFSLKVAGQIATYGWVTHGVECVGELERQFNLYDDETYVWDCSTLPVWRGRRCYSALLSYIIYRLHDERVPRIWIGASRLNRPSILGFANAGFKPVVDVTYRRFYRLTLLWIEQAASAKPSLVEAAYRILLDHRERRLGPLAIGYRR